MKRLLLILAVSLGLLFVNGTAHADVYPFRWAKHTVCIEMHASTHYPVKAAVHAWDDAPYLHLVYTGDCSGYSQVVKVYSGWYGKTGWAGLAMLRYSDGRLISPLWIKLNNTYAWNYSWTSRAHIASHEIGHTVGEAHTSYSRSVMGPDSYRYAYPQPYDYGEIGGLYS
jgi:hypothetical protein